MNKRADPKKLSHAVAAPQVPAIAKPPSRWKQFRRLMNDADWILELYDERTESFQLLRERKSGEPPPDLRDAQLLEYDKQLIARCRQGLRDIDRSDYYEEGDAEDEQPILKKKIISERLALMLGAVHIGGPQTPEAFLKMLLEHVYDAEVSYLALESGCRQIEQTEKYMQAISEVLKVLNEHEEQWNRRKSALASIEIVSNNLQEQIRQAQKKYERERAEKRLDEAKNLLERDVWQVNFEQGRARQAYQNVEAAMEQLGNDQAALDAAVAAAKAADTGCSEVVAVAAPQVPVVPQSPSEWQQFRILMNDLDEVRNRYDDLLSQWARPGGEEPVRLRYLRLIGFDKQQVARCRQWLHDIDRADYYEEAVVVTDNGPLPTSPRLSEETISKRLSAMLSTVNIGGLQNLETFRQNLSQYVYGAEVSYLVLESACREIEQAGKCPTISEVLKVLKEHQDRWDRRKSALLNIEWVSKQVSKVQAKYVGEQLKQTEDLLRKRQEEAREAYQRVEAAMDRPAKDQLEFDDAQAALDAAVAKSKQPRTC